MHLKDSNPEEYARLYLKFLNPEEYAEYCHIPLDLAIERCSHFKELYDKHMQTVCPACGADISKIVHWNDGQPMPLHRLHCTACDEMFPLGYTKLKYYYINLFDQVVDVIRDGKLSIMGCAYEDFTEDEWLEFVKHAPHPGNSGRK